MAGDTAQVYPSTLPAVTTPAGTNTGNMAGFGKHPRVASLKVSVHRGQGDGSGGKASVTQAGGPECDPQHTQKKPCEEHTSAILHSVGQRQMALCSPFPCDLTNQ